MRPARCREPRLGVALCCLVLGLSAGCGEPDAPEARRPRGGELLPAIEGPSSPYWSPKPTEEDPAVATVDGVPILLSQLRAAMERDGGESTADEVLGRLIDMEVVAHRALEEGYYRPDVVLADYRKAVAQELLVRRFKDPSPESFFSEELLEAVYKHSRVRVRFDHVDLFKVTDAQFVCCAGRYDTCDEEEFEACMKREEPNARQFYEYIKDKYSNLQSFQTLVREGQLTHKRLNLNGYSFFYDVNKPHDQQKGFGVVNENVARATMKLKEGEISPPVRSRNSWHIIFLQEHRPEEHRTLEDPEVRAALIERFLPKRQQAEFDVWTDMLRKRHNALVFPEAIDALFAGLTRDAQVN